VKKIKRYGRIEVGQRVRFERLVLGPGCESWTSDSTVTLNTEHTVIALHASESGALVELATDEGARQTCSVNSYGQLWGGFGMLHVLAQAPYQMKLAA
jgi:hypothetical protein